MMAGEGGGGAAAELGGAVGESAPGGGAAAPEWLGSLPDELKANPTLTRYADLEAFARGHLETKAAASAPKLPTADSAIDNFEAFHAARPADMAAYEITVPDGYPADFADGFRQDAFEIGLHPSQAKTIVERNNARVAAQLEAQQQAAAAEVEQFKGEIAAAGGDYQGQLNQVSAMLEKHGLGDADATMKALQGIEGQLGAGATLKLLFGLAQGFGEPATPPDPSVEQYGVNLNTASVDDIRKARQDKMQDKEWVKKARTPGTPENRQYNSFIAAESAAEKRRNQG